MDNRQPGEKSVWMRLLINLGLMALVAIVIGWLAMLWLDSWTMHGKSVEVPRLKGLSYQDAVREINDAGLTAVVSDSIYDGKTLPGTVIKQNPKENTTVKPGREIYLTINAFTPKTVTLPTLTDISVRQARSALEGLGITNIEEVMVPSDYQGLVLAVKCDGKNLYPGARVPISARIVLEVGDQGGMSVSEEGDTTAASAEGEMLDLF